jgi:membrane protease YdiL (CAAX protease family)
MPATSALILTALTGGRDAIRALLSRLALWQVNWKWWLAVILVQPILLGLTAAIYNLLWRNSQVALIPVPSISALIVNVIFLLIAVLGEEIGWHGVGLPALQQQRSAIKASVILSLIMAIWHLPFWLLLDTFDQFGFGYIGMNFLLVLPLTFYSTWFFNHTKFSVLLPVVFHLTFNIVNTALLPVTINIVAFGIFIVFDWAIAILLLSHLEPEPGNLVIRSGKSTLQPHG